MAYPKYHIQTQLMLVLTKNTYSEGWWLFFPPRSGKRAQTLQTFTETALAWIVRMLEHK